MDEQLTEGWETSPFAWIFVKCFPIAEPGDVNVLKALAEVENPGQQKAKYASF